MGLDDLAIDPARWGGLALDPHPQGGRRVASDLIDVIPNTRPIFRTPIDSHWRWCIFFAMTTTLLRPSLRYDPDTGIVEYLNMTGWHTLTAKDTSGYLHASLGLVDGKHRKGRVHRMVYAHFFGPIQDGLQVDHIDCDKLNNRLNNLRAVSRTVNCRNRKVPVGESGFPGVWWSPANEKWCATVSRFSSGRADASYEGIDARLAYAWYYATKVREHGLDSVRHLPVPKPIGPIKARAYAPKDSYYIKKNSDNGWEVYHRSMGKKRYMCFRRTREEAELAMDELKLTVLA